MYRVLVPVSDEVARAIAQAEFVTSLPAATEGVEVTVAHAYADDVVDRDTSGHELPPAESDAVIAVTDHLGDHDIPVESREIYRPVDEGIVDLAADVGADLVVMAGRKRSPVGKALFGSVTQAVILDSPVSVVVVDVRDD